MYTICHPITDTMSAYQPWRAKLYRLLSDGNWDDLAVGDVIMTNDVRGYTHARYTAGITGTPYTRLILPNAPPGTYRNMAQS